MNLGIALLAVVVGYVFGAISFARIVARWAVPGEDISSTTFDVPGVEAKMVMYSVSATSLSTRKGPKVGCLVGILDMLKAAVPMLIFRYAFPGQPYDLFAAFFAVVGHNFPVQHNFKGGRGLSPIMGSLFVIDWLSIPFAMVVGNLFGLVVLRDVLAAYVGFVVLQIPWMWYRFGDFWHVAYAFAVTALFIVSMRPELKQYMAIKRDGTMDDMDMWKTLEHTDMGRPIKYLKKYGLFRGKES